MRADKPALFHVLDLPFGGSFTPDSVSPVPEGRLEVPAVFVERERMEGELVVEAQMRSRKRYLRTLPVALASGSPSEPTVSHTPTNRTFVARENS